MVRPGQAKPLEGCNWYLECDAGPGALPRHVGMGVAMARILVAEDEDDIRELIERVLKREGHQVVSVSDGTAAVEMHKHQAFDLIVSDLNMPSLTGIQLAEKVRANPRCQVPFLLVTASATEEDLVRARRVGISCLMEKPFRLADLREQVSALLPNPHR